MNTILVCAAHKADRDLWMSRAEGDGAWIEPGQRPRAVFEALGLELRFEIFEHVGDADRIRGLELAGVLNFGAVRDQACRSMILARIRP